MNIDGRVTLSPMTVKDPYFIANMSDDLAKSFAALAKNCSAESREEIYGDGANDDDKEKMPPPTALRGSDVDTAESSHSGLKAYQNYPTVSQDDSLLVTTPAFGKSNAASMPTPFDSQSMIRKHLHTPSTAATHEQSFWSDQLSMSPAPMSPFSMPTPSAATKSDKRPFSAPRTGESPLIKKRRDAHSSVSATQPPSDMVTENQQ
jgi:hypothetical protein